MPSVLHILTDNRGLDTFPSVYNAIYLWKKQGWSNDIATPGDCTAFSQYIDRIYPLHPVTPPLPTSFPGAWGVSRIKKCYDLVITYEPKDLEAFYLARLLRGHDICRHHLHHSLEIPSIAFEGNFLFRLFHRPLLNRAYSDVDHLAIQDMFRYRLLCNYFPGVSSKPFSIVPNSFLDAVEPTLTSLPWFDKIRAEAKTLLVYIGGIERWALPMELMDEVAALQSYTFLFSGWSRDGYYEELASKFARYGHMLFDVRNKSLAELNYMVSQSDIGLAIYDSTDSNIANMGLSSGKFFKYMQHKKPVIINDIPFLNLMVLRNGIGAVYRKGKLAQNLSDAIKGIEYPQAFRDNFSYEIFYQGIIKQMTSL